MAADVLHDETPALDPTARRASELLQAELDRFERLLADLLEMSRFDAGAAELEPDDVDLRDVVSSVVTGLAALSTTTGCPLVWAPPQEEVRALVDGRRVARIVRNLVANALEHGERRPVQVRLGASADAVAVVVEDAGIGLAPGEASLVFNRFWRADPARARTSGGTGLGLSIALEDTKLHGGWLQAWGEPGRGSVFRLTLPRRPGAALVASPLPLVPPDAPPSPQPSPASSAAASAPSSAGPAEPASVQSEVTS
jgi:two-component system sensor histidine kinase MtrB